MLEDLIVALKLASPREGDDGDAADGPKNGDAPTAMEADDAGGVAAANGAPEEGKKE